MTPEEIEQMYQLQTRASHGQLDEADSKELIRLRRLMREEIGQNSALQKFNDATRVWRVSLCDVQDDAFPFYSLRRLTAEREMAYWGLGERLVLEEIDRAIVREKLRYDAASDCYYVDEYATGTLAPEA
jgi:hypothetical protein